MMVCVPMRVVGPSMRGFEVEVEEGGEREVMLEVRAELSWAREVK